MTYRRFDQTDEAAIRALLERTEMDRRTLLRGAALGAGGAAGLGLAGTGLAQAADNEHFFLFVELRGGVHWMLATDGRDVDQLPLDDPKTVFPLKITEEVPKALQDLLGGDRFGGGEPGAPDAPGGDGAVPVEGGPGGDGPGADGAGGDGTVTDGGASDGAGGDGTGGVGTGGGGERRGDKPDPMAVNGMNGRFICIPYLDTGDADVAAALRANYRKGKTTLGADFILGFAGEPLRPYVDDIAVVRGVHQVADFHGRANVEAFSCDPDSRYPHVAAVLAKLLETRIDRPLALDNLVFENATFAEGTATSGAVPVRLTAATLGAIARGAVDAGSVDPLSPARAIVDAVRRRSGMAGSYRKLLEDYAAAIAGTPSVKERLSRIRAQLGTEDASLDLLGQLRTATAMFTAGLTRVATVCFGAKTDNNDVDAFGLFDAHTGMYHSDGSTGDRSGSFKHHEKVQAAMRDLGTFIRYLKETDYGSKKLWDVVTVVVGTEFGRPSNFMGNEGGSRLPGAGHYWFNNNYLLFGKGVRGGAWVGGGDPIRQFGSLLDFRTLGGRFDAIRTTPIAFQDEGRSSEPEAYAKTGDVRPIQPRDVVMTVMRIAGFEELFKTYYPAGDFADTKVLTPLVR